jgi:hypothetical protein
MYCSLAIVGSIFLGIPNAQNTQLKSCGWAKKSGKWVRQSEDIARGAVYLSLPTKST